MFIPTMSTHAKINPACLIPSSSLFYGFFRRPLARRVKIVLRIVPVLQSLPYYFTPLENRQSPALGAIELTVHGGSRSPLIDLLDDWHKAHLALS